MMKRPWYVATACGISLCVFVVGCSGARSRQTGPGKASTTRVVPGPDEHLVVTPLLKPGPLPDDAAKALNAAIQAQYCDSDSFTGKSLRMFAGMRRAQPTDYLEIKSTGPPVPLANEHGILALRPIAPDHLRVGGLGDGSGIRILNLEELVFQADHFMTLGSAGVQPGAKLMREKGEWVLKAGPPANVRSEDSQVDDGR